MAATDSTLPFVSVIIPIYNDADRLQKCLDCLARQTYPQDHLEAIVVDNGSKESPRGIVEKYPFAEFAEEATPGSYAARNRGLELAQGEVLVFTDSDCLPEPDWLKAGICALQEEPKRGFIGGRIEVFPEDERKPTGIELFDMVFGLQQLEFVESLHFAATANLFTRRQTLERVGPFDSSLKSSGDAEWGQRATALGLGGFYCDEAMVRHPARKALSDLLRQIRRHAGGRFDRRQADPYRYCTFHFWRTLLKAVLPNIPRIVRARKRLKARGYGLGSWLKVTVVILIVQYVRFWEFMRKWAGAASERQ